MRVRDLLDVPGLGLSLLTDVSGMDRTIRHVCTTDLPDPSRHLTPGDLVLTGLIWCREPGDADRFVSALVKAGVAALGAGEALGQVPAEVIQACGRHGITLLAVPAETSFAAVTEEVGRRLSGDRATAMTRVLGRRRLLLSAVAEGAGLDAMFGLMGRELGVECWLLTGLGRVVGGTGASLPGPLALRLACDYLKADRLPAPSEVSAPGAGAGKYTLFGVGGEPRVTSWFLACAGHEQDWPHELQESVAELAADVALERARLDAARNGDRKLAEAIVARLASGNGEGAPAEIASLMRAAGLPPDGRYLVAAMCAAASAMVTGPHADRWRCDLAGELAVPVAERALVAPLGDEIVLLVPSPGDPALAGAGAAPADTAPGGTQATLPGRRSRSRAPFRGCDPRGTAGPGIRPRPDQAQRRGERVGRGRDRVVRRVARGRKRAAAGRAPWRYGHLGRDQRRGGLARALAGHRPGQRPAVLPRAPARPAGGLR